VTGLLACSSFLIYLRFRDARGIARTFELASWDELWNASRIDTFFSKLLVQFGVTGIALLVVSAVMLAAMARQDRARRWPAICLVGAAVTQVAFFYTDRASLPWTGYARFHLIALVAFAAAAWVPTAALRAHPQFRRIALAATVAVAAMQAWPLGSSLALLAGPDPQRSYTEADDAPIYMPIRALIHEAAEAGSLHDSESIAVANPLGDVFGYAYPVEAGRYKFHSTTTAGCKCTAEQPILLLPIAYPSGFAVLSTPAADVVHCADELRASYARVFEREIDGTFTGLLGVGCAEKPQRELRHGVSELPHVLGSDSVAPSQ
jgi:hypothetical protein